MSDDQDFAMDAEAPKPADESSESPPAPPLVVIEYRSRLSAVLLPPLLILMAALVIVLYQRQTQTHSLAQAPATSTPKIPAGPGRVIMVEGSGSGAAVEPIDVRTENRFGPPAPASSSSPSSSLPPAPATLDPADPDPAAVVSEAPRPAGDVAAEGAHSPFDLDPEKEASTAAGREGPPSPFDVEPGKEAPAAAGRVDEPAPESAPVAPPAIARAEAVVPLPTPEQFAEGLQREAQEKEATMKEMGILKQEAAYRELREIYQKAQDDRIPFLKELRFRVQTLGMEAGPEIANLCKQFGRETSPVIRETVVRVLKRSVRMSREAKVEMMRRLGLPEPMILDYLSNELDHWIGSRKGPRDRNEVRVLAARILLKVPFTPPLPPPSATAPAPGPATRPGASATAKSFAGVAQAPGPGAGRRPQ